VNVLLLQYNTVQVHVYNIIYNNFFVFHTYSTSLVNNHWLPVCTYVTWYHDTVILVFATACSHYFILIIQFHCWCHFPPSSGEPCYCYADCQGSFLYYRYLSVLVFVLWQMELLLFRDTQIFEQTAKRDESFSFWSTGTCSSTENNHTFSVLVVFSALKFKKNYGEHPDSLSFSFVLFSSLFPKIRTCYCSTVFGSRPTSANPTTVAHHLVRHNTKNLVLVQFY
jgi:hypothetical protein